jgi:hypothetical protein
MQREIQHKRTLPSPERRHYPLEDSLIPLLPNVPKSNDHHLRKERFTEFPHCSRHYNFQSRSRLPLNLKIIPYPYTEITMEKQMHPILSNMCRAENTKWIICNSPIPPSQHILSVEPITDQQPSKDFNSQNNPAPPNPFKNFHIRQGTKAVLII